MMPKKEAPFEHPICYQKEYLPHSNITKGMNLIRKLDGDVSMVNLSLFVS
jgi:hypothetical protein